MGFAHCKSSPDGLSDSYHVFKDLFRGGPCAEQALADGWGYSELNLPRDRVAYENAVRSMFKGAYQWR